MNSEEIKEIGRMFLSIQNNNGHGDADSIVAEVITAIQEQLAFVDYQALEASEEMLGKQIENVEKRRIAMEGTIKSITSNPENDLVKKIEERLNKAIDTSKNWRAEVNDKLRILHDGSWKSTEVDVKFSKFDKELHKLRKDYRELQDEMWERFKLIEDWIKSNTSKEKDTLKAEIAENSKEKKGKIILGSDAGFTRIGKVEPKRYIQNQEARQNWDNKDLLELDLSVRSFNALKNHGIKRIAQLINYSPTDLIKIKSFGRKCLHEVIDELKKKSLTLNMEKEKRVREFRKERIIKQFKL
jgi:hypothetical protein